MMRSLLTWNCHAHYASRAPFPGDMSEGKRIAELFRSVYEGDEKGEAQVFLERFFIALG